MSKQEPEALRLADMIEQNLAGAGDCEIAAELRRLHDFEEQHRAIDECWIREIAAVKQQRDALLEALRFINSRLQGHPAYDDLTEEQEIEEGDELLGYEVDITRAIEAMHGIGGEA